MVRAIERIEQDIAGLEAAIGNCAQQLQATYGIYLTYLGQAVRQQLILASYHLCTQGYPQNFLNLSLSRRQQLQQSIRKLGQQAGEELLSLMTLQKEEKEVKELLDKGGVGVAIPWEVQTVENLEAQEGDLDADESLASSVTPGFPDPVALLQWQQYLEKAIQQTLKTVSRDTNRMLQKAKVLPKKLPESILETAATSSEASAEMIPGPPNLLTFILEVENDRQAEETSLTQITAINLRLGEMEFADTKLSSLRKQIREVLAHLHKLGSEYKKIQKERAIAEAEAVWRASWYEE